MDRDCRQTDRSSPGKIERLRDWRATADTNLVSQQDVADQTILLQGRGRRQRDSPAAAQETADLAFKNAELNVESAKRSLELANKMHSGNRSLALAETLAQAQLKNSRVIAPMDGTVLKVFVKAGEAAVNAPLMQIGDLSRMECIAEVNDRIVRQVRIGQRATIKSPALSRDLVGTVRQISRVVGNSTLPNPNPLALVDTKTVDIVIEIDSADVGEAANFVHLQATVEIDPATTPPDKDGSIAQSERQR
jgi:ABC exporter DevB family membrane fusion protein